MREEMEVEGNMGGLEKMEGEQKCARGEKDMPLMKRREENVNVAKYGETFVSGQTIIELKKSNDEGDKGNDAS